MFHFSFIDPVFTLYLKDKYEIRYSDSSYFFFVLALGALLSCIIAPLSLKILKNSTVSATSSLVLGVMTMVYADSYILKLSSTKTILLTALFIAGFANGHLVVPTMDEMLEASHTQFNLRHDDPVLNNACSGLYNMSYALGDIFRPPIGSIIYSLTNFATLCDSVG